MDIIEKRLIVALDVDSLDDARRLVRELRPVVEIFKVGLSLFSRYGPQAVEMVQKEGGEVFLDLKLHDIPNTVAKAVKAACDLKIFMLTIHALGGRGMIDAAVQQKMASVKPYILGVTILTSIDRKEMKILGIKGGADKAVTRLAELCKDGGTDGVVASPLEARSIRNALGPDFLIVTPGIRLEKIKDDQKRVLSPREAIKEGADFIVVGRPILEAENPFAVAREISEEVKDAFQG